jgi:hypothetical protein
MHPDLIRTGLARAWRARAQAEARVSRSFASLLRALPAGELPSFIREALTRAVEEEAQHSELCEGMVARYAELGAAPDEPADPQLPLATPAERAAVLVSAACISESIASAYLERCHARARVPAAREVLHALLTDEVGHAQIGWAYVAGLPKDSPQREAITRSARPLIERVQNGWRERVQRLHAVPDADHGYPPADELCAVIDQSASDLVRRGFYYVGVAC